MPADIRLYFEGDKSLKPGFDAFLKELRRLARGRCEFRLISARSGAEARQDFELAKELHPEAWSILLIDSDGPPPKKAVPGTFWMVEMMESWFHADKDALAEFYGQGFKRRALKPNLNVEEIPKVDLERGLQAATKGCQKGAYHKTRHAPRLLELINPALVCAAARNCDRFFKAIQKHLA